MDFVFLKFMNLIVDFDIYIIFLCLIFIISLFYMLVFESYEFC